ncbi:extradiol dioxygenase [Pandoraea fibrosis]|nr:extradiol dioxygenase [Pandoraea fibrosis]
MLGLDHFTLRTAKLEETKEFFMKVAELHVGPRPAFQFPGYWLYRNQQPVVHLAQADVDADEELSRYLGERPSIGPSGSGALDHIAFRCEGLPDFEQRLRALEIAYRARTVPDLREHQIFVSDPNDIVVEFIFSSEELASWVSDDAGVSIP